MAQTIIWKRVNKKFFGKICTKILWLCIGKENFSKVDYQGLNDPIEKIGNYFLTNLISEHRPISLTPTKSKIMEKL